MIFNHSKYTDFLKEYIHKLPKRGYGEAKKMALYLEVSSTYMSQILSGEKNLSLEQVNSLSAYLNLDTIEAEYFFYLVQRERAGTLSLKKFCEQKIQELKLKSMKIINRVEAKKKLTDQEKSIFYSSPLYSSIHVFCATKDIGYTVDEIALRFNINRIKTNEIIQFLLVSGLCVQTNSRIQTGTIGTHLEFGSPYLLKHHTNWRLRSIKAAESLAETELMYTVNVALSEKDFHHLREEMAGFIKEFLKTVYPSPSEKIACLNLDWFWIRD